MGSSDGNPSGGGIPPVLQGGNPSGGDGAASEGGNLRWRPFAYSPDGSGSTDDGDGAASGAMPSGGDGAASGGDPFAGWRHWGWQLALMMVTTLLRWW